MNIITREDVTGFAPPGCRYSAVDDDTYDGAPDSRNRACVGYGATPAAAVADLLQILADDEHQTAEWQAERDGLVPKRGRGHPGGKNALPRRRKEAP